MSGHNKWSKIKNKKAVEDAKKSKLFSMYSKTITIESKKAGGDINSPGLRAAVERARAVNMPADNINRAVEKGRPGNNSNLEEVLYEAFAPGGVAMIIEGITDNKNRTTPEIKHLLSLHQASLGGTNSALWAFTKTDQGWQAGSLMPVVESVKNSVQSLIEDLESHDDVNRIFINAELN
ncbi:MAG: hypothetical protein A2589_00340 [Candidatus Vogelbacteria bacterium RIFOXYD1_FULL_46_19]|uniref:Transcriptional regulator n=1 Tax=Candidatus Vogelbacteria bacterium RIFOXYD1_FULL_46_19 TaxID=1802439 RepID=A0A1G2QHQ3_9BACT|nr:MAG: hypothetical protein A2589_00340 [Candidatus Vogelbacteria bacterium RIFOXYD1_FULL_46_19]